MNLIEKKESDNKLIDLAYILGIALIIAAIVYFFAANWGGLGRGEKVILISLLLIGFYGLAFLLDRFLVLRPLVGKLAFFSGVLAFGVSVALLGQVYNSHADSYLLFFIWLIPALLFSLITRYQMFDVLAYILAHLTFIFYLFPTSVSYFRSDNEILAYLLVLSFFNISLFILLKKKWINSPLLTYVSFIVFHIIWFGLTMRGMFDDYTFLLNVVYNLILIAMLYFFIKKQQAQTYIVFTTIAYAFYVLEALFSWMIYRAAEWLYLLNMAIAFVMIVLTILFIRWMNKRMQMNKSNDEAHDANRKPWWHKLLVEVISFVSALLLAGAFIGLTALLFGEFLFSFYIGIAIALLLLVIATAKKLDEIVIHALVYFSLLLSFVAVWESSIFFVIVYLLLLPVVWIRTGSTTLRTMVYGAGLLLILISMFRFEFTFEADILLLFSLNAALLVASFMIQIVNMHLLTKLALFYSLLFGFVLTFLFGESPLYYYSINFLFFIITTAAGFYFIKENKKSLAKIVFIFWFAFLAYKYYDVVWKLLHKSIGLFIVGAVYFLVAILFDRRKGLVEDRKNMILPKKLSILAVIVLQLLFIGYQYVINERVLAHGDLIKLELQPIDPRSMLQGDYIRLGYEISRIPELTEQFHSGEKLVIVLSPNEDGFYKYSGIYKHKGEFNLPYEQSVDDVLINATFIGYDQLNYGIESYFIEEGTGTAIEQQATKAYVKVAANGNAILEKIE